MEIDNNTIQNDYIEKNSIVNVENINSFSTETLNLIKQTIENMDKVHHIEILKLLENQYDVNLNENNNGTFINLTDLKNETIQKLQEYINYFKKQQNQLINLEDQKKQIENCFFN
uniref:NET domain-containing protein n=1 Tax=Nucleocytoviricota sp. TaxID=2809609 RepID=A0A9E8G552_9VIRU|nr:hypothetical protein [Nucleocytoviricota sp.]